MAAESTPDLSRLNNVAHCLSGVALSLALAVDSVKYFIDPHYFDGLTPAIETHFGNVSTAMLVTQLTYFILSKSGATRTRASLLAFYAATSSVLFIEAFKPSVSEVVGDISFALGASLITLGLLNLPHKLIKLKKYS